MEGALPLLQLHSRRLLSNQQPLPLMVTGDVLLLLLLVCLACLHIPRPHL